MDSWNSIAHRIETIDDGSAPQELVHLCRDVYDRAKAEIGALKSRIAELETEKADLQSRLKRHEDSAEYIEASGLLWRKTPEGIEGFPHCPKCLTPMFHLPPENPEFWTCSSCDLTHTWMEPPSTP